VEKKDQLVPTLIPLAAKPVALESGSDARAKRPRPTVINVLFYVIMILWGILSLGPLLWMLINSLRTNTEIFTSAIGAPSLANLSNYVDAWVTADLGQALINSMVVSVGAVVIAGFCSVLIGFALSRGHLPFPNVLLTFFLAGLMIPTFSVLLPILIQYQGVGLTSNRFGLTLVYAGFQVSLGVFLFKGAFDSVPKEYMEAAALDGASVPRMLARIILPMVRPTMATFAILTFLSSYNDFVFALVLNNDPSKRTLPVALLGFSGQYGTQYNLIFAAVSISTIPPLLAYLFLRKQVQSSMAMGGRTG
jgi:raffinose/stachyose/melibiose transport system permease protein